MILAAILLCVVALLGAPLFAVIAASALLGFYRSEVDLSVVAIEIFRLVDTPALVAIPLFTLTGYVLSESRASQRLVRLTDAVLGWMPGGLAIVAVAACAFFTALTGASGVTIIALGALLYPALTQAGYSERFSLGLITSSGSLGLLFPPSIALILYGVIAQQMSIGQTVLIDDLFIAGILPLLLMIFLLTLWILWSTRNQEIVRSPFTWRSARQALWQARWELPLVPVLFGGIYGGWFAISEIAAITALYVLIAQVFLYREIRLSEIPRIMVRASTIIGEIILILAVSLALTNVFISAEVPTLVFDMLREFISSKYSFLLLLNIVLLVLGAILDIFSAIVIMVPLILPVALSYGVHPIHLGIIFLANMQIGYFTPPVGMNLFIASTRFNKPIAQLYQATIPYFFVLMLAVLLITYIPVLSLGPIIWLAGGE